MGNNFLCYIRFNTAAAWGNPKIRSALIVGLYHPRIRPAHRVHGVVKFVDALCVLAHRGRRPVPL
jgi:hypothetical protein